mmetsp:Transcript_11656/g.21651  ORF Transcript_11656/g.21651 Transcript_11656/m.21651 type:complete len:463 (+) Transcript_11656:229-1617(+)
MRRRKQRSPSRLEDSTSSSPVRHVGKTALSEGMLARRDAFCEELQTQRSAKHKKAKVMPRQVQKEDGGWFGVCALKGRRDYMEDTWSCSPATKYPRTCLPGSGSPLPQEDNFDEIEASETATEAGTSDDTSVSVFGMYDGHGGSLCSDFCAKEMSDSIREHPDFPEEPEKVLTESFLALDKILCQVADDVCFFPDGTTATVAVVEHEKRLHIAHVGDTRSILVRKDGNYEQLTRDHSCDLPDEVARVVALGGFVRDSAGTPRVQGVIAVTRAIGDAILKPYVIAKPELKSIDLSSGDYSHLCIATDGVWEQVKMGDVVKIVQDSSPLEAAGRIAEAAVQNGSEDNATCMIIDLAGGAVETTESKSSDELKAGAALKNTPHIVQPGQREDSPVTERESSEPTISDINQPSLRTTPPGTSKAKVDHQLHQIPNQDEVYLVNSDEEAESRAVTLATAPSAGASLA